MVNRTAIVAQTPQPAAIGCQDDVKHTDWIAQQHSTACLKTRVSFYLLEEWSLQYWITSTATVTDSSGSLYSSTSTTGS